MPALHTDEELSQRALNGDAIALEEFLARQCSLVIAVSYSVLGNREDALDAAQAALMRITGAIRHGTLDCKFYPFICSCARNSAIDLRRSRASRAQKEATVAHDPHKTESLMPDQTAVKAEAFAALREELAQLPEETANVLELHHLADLPIDAIAMQTGLSPAACKHRLIRGRRLLRERLERRGFGIATAALAAGFLEEFFHTARVEAAELNPLAVNRLVRNTLAATLSKSSSTTASAKPGMADSDRNASNSMRARHRIAGVAVACGIIAAAITTARLVEVPRHRASMDNSPHRATGESLHLASSGASQPKTPTYDQPLESVGPTSPPAGSRDITADAAARGNHAPDDTELRAQPMRFIKGRYEPLSLGVYGQRVLLLASHDASAPAAGFDPHRIPPLDVVVFESLDEGESWHEAGQLKGYGQARLAHGSHGEPIILGFHGSLPADFTGLPVVGYSADIGAWQNGRRQATRLDGDTPQTALVGGDLIISPDGAEWNFFGRHDKSVKWTASDPNHVVAWRNGGGAPYELDLFGWSDAGLMGFYAASRDAAGMVKAKRASRQYCYGNPIMHYFTRDGGATWNNQEIPFDLKVMDSTPIAGFSVTGAVCKGQTILVPVQVGFESAPTSPQTWYVETYLVSSSDLGESWSAPTLISKRHPSISTIAVFLGAEQAVVCDDCTEDAHQSIRMVEVRTSRHGGPWNTCEAFKLDTSQDFITACAAGAGEQSVHVAFATTSNGKPDNGNDSWLCIRSFSTRPYTPASGEMPSWYKGEPDQSAGRRPSKDF